jgi:hypothetical protein
MPPTTVRVHYRNEADLQAAREALGGVLGPSDRQLAEQAAQEASAEFTGRMERAFVDYEDHWQALTELAAGAKGKRKQELLARRAHMKASTEWRLRADFTRLYRDQFLNGKQISGNARPLQRNEREIVRRLVNNEMEFALNALLDCETGEYKMALDRRGRLYGQALGESLWAGVVYSNLSSGRYLRWRLSHEPGASGKPLENCPDCLWLSGDPVLPGSGGRWGNGVFGVREIVALGVFPQSAKLACTTNCHCTLEDTDRPETAPHGKAWKHFESAQPKIMTMLNRATDPVKRARLAALASEYEHVHIKRRQAVTQPEHLHR